MSSRERRDDTVQLLPPGHAAYGKVYKVVLASRGAHQTLADGGDAEPTEAVALPPPPVLGERVAIHYRAYVAAKDTDLVREPDAQGRVQFDSSSDSVGDASAPFTFVLGRHQVIPVVELALFTMRPGERALVRCLAPKYAYNGCGRKAKRGQWVVKPNCASIELEITFLGTVRMVGGFLQLVSANGGAATALPGETRGGSPALERGSDLASAAVTATQMASMTLGDDDTAVSGTLNAAKMATTTSASNVTAPPLLRYRKTRAFTDLQTDAERLAYALEAKELGNYYFKGGQLEAATQEYEVALQTLQLWGKRAPADASADDALKAGAEPDPQVEVQREQLTRTLLNNLARVHYRRGAYHDAIRLAGLVLESLKQATESERTVDGENTTLVEAVATTHVTNGTPHRSLMVKALFTRGQAHRQLGDYDEAKRDLVQVTRLETKHTAAKKELEQLQQLIEAHRRREKRAFGGIFSSATRRASTASHLTHSKGT
ncbi:hypothetical protein CCYA_CCYA05G1594 [Cyanidiococcus yangmingshanensis]|nr:hypothetical protein CCYA_CCYA05G1594 [Cyanidiococcus yangmingshanensis]